MFAALIPALVNSLTGGLLSAYKARLDAANTTGAQAVTAVQAALQAETEGRREAAKLAALELGNWWTAMPRLCAEWSFALYIGKVIVWDNMLGLGTTDPLRGDVGTMLLWLGAMWFGGTQTATVIRAVRSWWR